ncbi:50S ribosomal protein L11 methyltransferase [Candidatus Gottesmanbacteria bacterium]|nr:50S ribosomal protein L11 methyltransferase [Candidatus Gottesmanbacteria bacterium]
MTKNSTKKPVEKQSLIKRMCIPFDGDTLKIEYDSRVYAPTSHSSLLGIYNFSIHIDDRLGAVVGTGTGIDAIAMVKKGMPRVIATDIDAHALEIARRNAHFNHVSEKIIFKQGDMFDPLATFIPEGQRFDVILSNPPCLPVPESLSDDYPVSLDGGPDGTKYLAFVIEQARTYLNKPKGRLYINFGSTSNPKKLFSILDTYYFWKETCRITIPFSEQFLLLWDYLGELRGQGKAEFWEEHGVPMRWYATAEARPK